MNQTPSMQRYDLITQVFHWTVVVLIIGLLVTDWLRDGAPKPSDLRTGYLNLHVSLGILIFLVTIARIGWSRLVGAPDPVAGSRLIQLASKGAHLLLNLATLLIPIFGFLRLASKDRAADFFGLIQIPSPFGNAPALNDLMHILHGEPMELFLYGLIALHVAAALWHQYYLRDHTLERMLPWSRRAVVRTGANG
ncbi:cytochrome b [Thiocystis violacea]|uniref:cytochrome b n=1 Tax=Thiocystis violacea TaxID=13725 RepID=UPI0019031239|nr:cytochrome b [Thiocystis violacea]MBK1716129.1 cytochrome B [Thiocystis violacea]